MNKCFGYIFFNDGRESDLYIQTIASLLIYFQKIIKQLSAMPFSKTVIFNLKILLFFFQNFECFHAFKHGFRTALDIGRHPWDVICVCD